MQIIFEIIVFQILMGLFRFARFLLYGTLGCWGGRIFCGVNILLFAILPNLSR